MIRGFHRWLGLIALVLVIPLSLSGAALSVFPAAERLGAAQADAAMSVAELAARIQASHPGVEQIKRAPSGRIIAYWYEKDSPGSAVIDPATGQAIAPAEPDASLRWLTTFHRSLFFGDAGRLVMAAGAAGLLVLSISGLLLMSRRTGGLRGWFGPLKGASAGRLHVEAARIAVAALILSSATSLWMTASTFDLLPDGAPPLARPEHVSESTALPVSAMESLKRTPVGSLRELSFPASADSTDVLALTTKQGTGYIDPGTGALLAWSDHSVWARATDTVYMLHTGRGAALLGIVIGLLALGVPVISASGAALWFTARRRPNIRGNAPASEADTILLVGSEGGSTWGFAATLCAALEKTGQKIHAGPLSGFEPAHYTRARRFVILAATYGNGDAPQSAGNFLVALNAMERAPSAPLAVLGFGDSSFPRFCGFAQKIDEAASARGWPRLTGFDTVNRQSPQEFARWGRELGAALGIPLELTHVPPVPAVTSLQLLSRRDYGAEVQAPAAILRFAVPRPGLWQELMGKSFGGFQAGDLLGILPEGSAVPRFYSLASGAADGFLEIVVRKHAGGLCSGQLLALEPGGSVTAFLRPNPTFHPGRGKAPLILVGAGSGIGPLAGFVRANKARRPISMYFGFRHAESDFFYREELNRWQEDGRLTRLVTASSRGTRPRYVQDALRAEAIEVRRLIRDGARIMVCGGRDMAASIAEALEELLAPIGLTPLALKVEGRYVEDVY